MKLALPTSYIKLVNTLFPDEASAWLNNTQNLLANCQTNFGLRDLQLIENLSYNLVLSAHCKQYGPVIVKICLPGDAAMREILALEKYQGHYACRCYYCDTAARLMILERLIPGASLRQVKKRDERVAIFADLASNLLITASDCWLFPTYREVIDQAFSKTRLSGKYSALMSEQITKADAYYQEIENRNLEKFLLHADLHHDNILTTPQGRKAIDPHGLIGERVLETARFLENELPLEEITQESVFKLSELLAQHFKEDRQSIAQAWFIDYVLSLCWDLEDNNMDWDFSQHLGILDLIDNAIKTNS